MMKIFMENNQFWALAVLYLVDTFTFRLQILNIYNVPYTVDDFDLSDDSDSEDVYAAHRGVITTQSAAKLMMPQADKDKTFKLYLPKWVCDILIIFQTIFSSALIFSLSVCHLTKMYQV